MPKTKTRSVNWTGIIGVLLSVLLLAWALRDVHLSEMRDHVANMHIGWFVGCIAMATLRFILVTERWRYLLRMDGAVLPYVPMWHATTIGFMANNLLPARTGEVARAYAAHSMTGVKFTSAAASIAVERVMDGVTLVVMLGLATMAGGFSGEVEFAGVSLGSLLTFTGVVFTAALVVAALVAWQQERATALATKVFNAVLPARWASRLLAIMTGLIGGLDSLKSPKRFLAVSAWSVGAWGMNGMSFLMCMWAFQIDAPWTAAFVLQSIIAFGVALPQAPGFWGVFEAATRATLLAYGISSDAAVSYAVSYHLGTFFPITFLGIYSLSRANLSFGDLRNRARPIEDE